MEAEGSGVLDVSSGEILRACDVDDEISWSVSRPLVVSALGVVVRLSGFGVRLRGELAESCSNGLT